MHTKYVVRLSEEERSVCQGIHKTLKGSSQRLRRAQLLRKADAEEAGGRTSRVPRPAIAVCKPLSVSANVWSLQALSWLWTASNARSRPRLASLMARPQPSGSPCDWGSRRWGTDTGHCPCSPTQCLSDHRIGDLSVLQTDIAAWSDKTHNKQRGVDWQFRIENARVKRKRLYHKIQA